MGHFPKYVVGFWFGTLIGTLLGVWIADRPGWKWFAGAVSGFAAFVAMIPDLVHQIVTGAKRFRSAARR